MLVLPHQPHDARAGHNGCPPVRGCSPTLWASPPPWHGRALGGVWELPTSSCGVAGQTAPPGAAGGTPGPGSGCGGMRRMGGPSGIPERNAGQPRSRSACSLDSQGPDLGPKPSRSGGRCYLCIQVSSCPIPVPPPPVSPSSVAPSPPKTRPGTGFLFPRQVGVGLGSRRLGYAVFFSGDTGRNRNTPESQRGDGGVGSGDGSASLFRAWIPRRDGVQRKTAPPSGAGGSFGHRPQSTVPATDDRWGPSAARLR